MRSERTRQARRLALPQKTAMPARHRRQDALLDQALLETFPASDPISVMQIT